MIILKRFLLIAIINLITIFMYSSYAYAIGEYSGYDGGISSGFVEGKAEYDYQEVQFISGYPVLFTGKVVLKRSKKNNLVESKYDYALKNSEYNGTLTRSITYKEDISEKDNSQETCNIKVSGKPSEVIVIKDATYTLSSIDFIKSSIMDKRPAINYIAGNIWAKKNYTMTKLSNYNAPNNTENITSGNVSVEIYGDSYGYNEYWGNTGTISYKYLINGENVIGENIDRWGGKAEVKISSSVSKQFIYMENQPEIISFSGGYIRRQYNNNILEYNSELPEFDQDGLSTDIIKNKYKSYTMDSYPIQERLGAVDFPDINGHWAEMDIKKLFGIEIFKSKNDNYKPESYTNRGEYVSRVYNAVKDVPDDPSLKKTSLSTNTSKASKTVKSPFKDIPSNYPYINEIVGAYNKGVIQGSSDGNFNASANLKFVDAIVILIRCLGLDNINITNKESKFRDEDEIPEYGKKSVYVAERIGLIKGDTRGYLKPNEILTNARSSALIVRFIDYLSEGMKGDFREGILTY